MFCMGFNAHIGDDIALLGGFFVVGSVVPTELYVLSVDE